MPSRHELHDIANYLVPNQGDEEWLVDPNQLEQSTQWSSLWRNTCRWLASVQY